MKVMDHSAGRQPERIIIVNFFVGLFIISGVKKGATARIIGLVLFRRTHCAGPQIMTIVLAIVSRGIEFTVCIKTLSAIRKLFVAWPTHAASFTEHLVTHAGIITGPAA